MFPTGRFALKRNPSPLTYEITSQPIPSATFEAATAPMAMGPLERSESEVASAHGWRRRGEAEQAARSGAGSGGFRERSLSF